MGSIASLPGWARWALYAAIGILVLSLVQTLTGETTELTSVGTSQAMLRWGVPILLAGLGGLFSERAGVVNIGLEGMMVLGMWFGAWGAINFGAWAGLIIGVLGVMIGALIHAIATVNFGVDHIISGVAINIIGPAAARYLSSEIFSGYDGGSITQSPRVPGVGKFDMPLLAGGDVFGWQSPDLLGAIGDLNLFFVSDAAQLIRGLISQVAPSTIVAIALVPISWFVLWRTRFGLRLRICGESPKQGEAQGIDVYRYKYYGVLLSGALAGLGGAFIASPELGGIYLEGQVNNRGFIGLAALIFGNYRPAGILVGAMLFAYPFGLGLRDIDETASHTLLLVTAVAMVALALWATSKGRRLDMVVAGSLAGLCAAWYFLSDTVPGWWVNILPFVIVLLVLFFNSQRLRVPAADGMPYRRGE